ncbi:MAG: MBL fold metallo-hydrolase [Clostridia bacterium]|nr:MBL fold metallo-hydrolase [Clostridia bacterium]
MKFQTLCSGSKGNCAVLQSEQSKILIDIGMPLSVLEKDLLAFGIRPEKIDAVFITHEHSDHISGLESFSKKYDKQVFVHKKGFLTLAKKSYYANHKITHFDKPFVFKDLSVSTFECSHDSAYCCGYRFDDGKTAIATITDLGVADSFVIDFVKGCKLVLLESNHDEETLINGDYPAILKKRISGLKGHLSNAQASRLAVEMQKVGVKRLLLGHLSQNNNSPELAFYETLQMLNKNNIREGVDIVVDVVTQDKKSEVYHVE